MSSASDVASATTLVAPPPAPSVTVTATSSEIDLSWTDVAGETGYRIERSTDGTDWAQIGTTGADVTTYADGGLPSGSTFSYRVFATNAGGDSPPSDVVSAQTLAQAPAQQATDTQAPAAAPSEVAQPLARTRATRETRSR
jgi:titin